MSIKIKKKKEFPVYIIKKNKERNLEEEKK